MVSNARRAHGVRLGYRLVLAVSGVTLTLAACAGRSERGTGGGGGDGASSASGGSGGTRAMGGTSNEGSTAGGAVSKGGTAGGAVSKGGSSGTDSTGRAGSVSNAGRGGTAASGGAPHGCVELAGRIEPNVCEGPFRHHPAGAHCDLPAHPEAAAAGAGGEAALGPPPRCATDADCTAEPNGYCIVVQLLQGLDAFCQYACHEDADCDSDELCSCDPFVSHVDGGSLVLGVCKKATCRSDDDCGPGLLCISPVTNPCAGYEAFSCQTAEDQCRGPDDCADGQRVCAPESGRFVCSEGSVC